MMKKASKKPKESVMDQVLEENWKQSLIYSKELPVVRRLIPAPGTQYWRHSTAGRLTVNAKGKSVQFQSSRTNGCLLIIPKRRCTQYWFQKNKIKIDSLLIMSPSVLFPIKSGQPEQQKSFGLWAEFKASWWVLFQTWWRKINYQTGTPKNNKREEKWIIVMLLK